MSQPTYEQCTHAVEMLDVSSSKCLSAIANARMLLDEALSCKALSVAQRRRLWKRSRRFKRAFP
jgi:hypothetical protein